MGAVASWALIVTTLFVCRALAHLLADATNSLSRKLDTIGEPKP